MSPESTDLVLQHAAEMPIAAILLGGVVAALVSAALVPVAINRSRRWRVLDRPDERKHQTEPIPRLGGLAIAGGLAVGLLATLLLRLLWPGLEAVPPTFGFLAAATMLIFAVGLVDDIRDVSPMAKFAVQIVAAALVVSGAGYSFERVSLPLGGPVELGIVGPIIAILWIVGITNAVNLMDGLDGLAGGVAAIIAASLLVFSALQKDPWAMAVAAALCGACVGFLPANWRPARIYLGDAGSLTIGFVLATVSLAGSLKSSTAVAVLVPLLALGVPAIDTLLVMVVRFLERPGHPILRRVSRMFEADRQHLHHLVLALAMRRRWVVVFLYALVAFFCLTAVLAAVSGSPLVALAVLVVEVVVVIVVRQSGIRARARALSRAQREALKEELGIEAGVSAGAAELDAPAQLESQLE